MLRLITCILSIALFGCGAVLPSKKESDPGKMQVLCTTPIIADLVRGVGGDRVQVTSLMNMSMDPHSYELVKGDDEKFSRAHVVFYNGLGLEHSGSLQNFLARHPRAYSLGNYIQQLDPSFIVHTDDMLDPHVWLDVSLWSMTLDLIVETLSSTDPSGKEVYAAQGKIAQDRLTELDRWIEDQLRSIPQEKKYLITSHGAFHYFTRRYLSDHTTTWRDRSCAPEGLAPDGQLGFRDLERVVSYVRQHGVTTLFPEENVATDSLKKVVEICRTQGIHLHLAHPPLCSDTFTPGASDPSYEAMMRRNVQTLVEAWGSS